jgi:hypothetical protein
MDTDKRTGFRDLEDPSKIVVSGAFASQIPNTFGTCTVHPICKETHKLMDIDTGDENHPLPLPVDKPHRQ